MEWLILIFLVPLILVPIVLLCGFAGCGIDTKATGDGPSVAAPSDLHAKATGVAKIDLRWNNNTGGPTTFSINRALEGAVSQEIRFPETNNTFIDQTPGLVEGTTYSYFVKVKIITDDGSESGFQSNSVWATTLPATPTNLVSTPIDGSHVQLTWQNVSHSATKFILEHRDSPVSPWHTVFLGPGTTTPAGITPAGSDEFRVTAVVVDGWDDSVQKDIKSEPSPQINAATGIPITPFKTAYNIPLTTNDGSLGQGETIVQKIDVAHLTNSGNAVRITLHGSTNANLLIKKVTISQVRPGGINPYDSAADLAEVKSAGKSGVLLPANTPTVLDVTNYRLDRFKDLLIAFEINGPSPCGKTAVLGATMFHKPGTSEAGLLPNRSTGYAVLSGVVFLVEKIEVT